MGVCGHWSLLLVSGDKRSKFYPYPPPVPPVSSQPDTALVAARQSRWWFNVFKSRSDVRSEKKLLRGEKPEVLLFKGEQTQQENEATGRSEGSTGTLMSLVATNEARK